MPSRYGSGNLSNSATWSNATFASLGLTPGTYVWTWGSGEHQDSFTLNIRHVPEPTTLTLLGSAVACLAWLRRRRRREQRSAS